MLAVIGAVGQAEREAMLERQRDGIARAKAQGRYKGRCRPFANRLLRSSGSNRRASGPRKSPAGWGSVGRACIGCWATRPPVNIKKLPDRLSAGPKDRDQRPTFDQMLKDAVRLRSDILMVWSIARLGPQHPARGDSHFCLALTAKVERQSPLFGGSLPHAVDENGSIEALRHD